MRPMFGGGLGPAGEEGGMLVGPGHPGFWNRPPHPESYRPSPTLLPPYKEAFRYLELHEQLGLMSAWLRGAVPPGARFDPITPIDPTGGEAPGWPSGEPDPDAEPILGPRVDPVRPGWRPPKRPPGGGPFEGGSGSGGPFDSGGPPFFR